MGRGKIRFVAFLASAVFAFSSISRVAKAETDPVLFALSVRHMTATPSELETAAGGKDALISRLLELRSQEKPPFVGVRAEKLLLGYADEQAVENALTADLQSAERKGLARLVTIHLQSVPSEAVRGRLAKQALDRAGRETDFAPYARVLLESPDSEVKKLARERLK